MVSLGGPITFKNARAFQDTASQLDPKRLMLETDAPYLTPHPYRGARNEPARIPLILDRLAKLLGMSPEALAFVTSETALRFFGLEDAYSVGHTASHNASIN